MLTPIALMPSLGYVSSAQRQEVGGNRLVSGSFDWLLRRGCLVRRKGSAIFGDTLTDGHETTGILPTDWDALARRMYSLRLPSMTDGYPTQMLLFCNESYGNAQPAWRSRNDDSWHTLGAEFSATHYPATGVPNFRVVPLLYRNEYGGLTLHRLNTERDRRAVFGGSRNLAFTEDEVAAPCYSATPCRWNKRWNDAAGSGTEACEVFPLGLIMPLACPTVVKGELTGNSGADKGPWQGDDAFFYTCAFENEAGEISMFALPRPEGSSYDGYPGFAFVHLDSSNPNNYFREILVSGIPVGPPGTKWVRLARTNKVKVSGSDTTNNFPAINTLQWCGRVANGTTTYTDTEGNDLSLTPDSRLQEMWRGGLTWPWPSRYIGYFDGHFTLGDLRKHPGAIVIAPWKQGDVNAKIDAEGLYGSTAYFVAVGRTTLILREVTSGVVTDTEHDLAGQTVLDLVDKVNTASTVAYVQHLCTGTPWTDNLTCTESLSDLTVGMYAIHPDIPAGTRIEYLDDANNHIRLDHRPTSSFSGEAVTFRTLSASTGGSTGDWASQVVPGADNGTEANNLLRTYLPTACSFVNGESKVTVTALSEAAYITPGMLAVNEAIPEGTIVTAVDETTGEITLSAAVTGDSATPDSVTFAYDTGDSATAGEYGFVRAFANSFPAILYFGKSYLDEFSDKPGATAFSVASPGYPQDALNTWMAKNFRNAPAGYGPVMGLADLGPVELHLHSRGRILLANTRTGESHVDEDYTPQGVSWNRGARSPYAICTANQVAFFVSDEGVFAASAGNEALLSQDIYRRDNRDGEKGDLEYAIAACYSASEARTDDYRIHMDLHGSVLHLRYWSSAAAGRPDRELRYDFSEAVGREGLAGVMRTDGTPFGWSAPLTIGPSCSAEVADADGVHLYGAVDSNAGTGNGRVDEFDVGTEDNGALVAPVGYTGLATDPGGQKAAPQYLMFVGRKAVTGLTLAVATDPETEPSSAEWLPVILPESGNGDYVRGMLEFPKRAIHDRTAMSFRIMDDGSGDCPEIMRLTAFVELQGFL